MNFIRYILSPFGPAVNPIFVIMAWKMSLASTVIMKLSRSFFNISILGISV